LAVPAGARNSREIAKRQRQRQRQLTVAMKRGEKNERIKWRRGRGPKGD